MRIVLIASLLLALPMITVDAVGKSRTKPSKSAYDSALAYCRKTYGTSLESVELTKRYGTTGYFCVTRY